MSPQYHVRARTANNSILWVGIAPYPWAISRGTAKFFSTVEADAKIAELRANKNLMEILKVVA